MLAAGAAALMAGCSDASRLSDPFANPFGSADSGAQRAASYRGVDRSPTATIPSRVESRPLPAPGASASSAQRTPAPAAAAAPLPAGPAVAHWTADGGTPITVAQGETAGALATRYGVPTDALLRANGYSTAAQVQPGTRLVIPVYRAGSGGSAVARSAPAAAPAATTAPVKVAEARWEAKAEPKAEAKAEPKPDPKAEAAAAREEQRKAEAAAKAARDEQRKAEAAAKLAREEEAKAKKSKAAADEQELKRQKKAEAEKAAEEARLAKVAAEKAAAEKAAEAKRVAEAKKLEAKKEAELKAAEAKKVADAKKAEAKKEAELKAAEAKAAAEKAKLAKAEAAKSKADATARAEAAKAAEEAKLAKAEAAKAEKAQREAAALAAKEAKEQQAAAAAVAKEQKLAVAEKPAAEAVPAVKTNVPVEEATTRVAATTDGDRPEFRWPARGRIIQGFSSGGNDGINIAVPEGTPVKAADDGKVAYAGSELKGYGNLVLIRHDNGFVTAYAHNGELSVKRGDTVKRGQMIAKSGQSGNVGSPQLHFELRKGSTPVDPTSYLAGL